MKKVNKINNLIIIPLLTVIILSIGITYAIFTKTININKEVSIKTGTKYIGVYGENKTNVVSGTTYTFTIENRGVENSGYYLYLDDITKDIDLSNITYSYVKNGVTTSKKLSEVTTNRQIDYGNLLVGEKVTITLSLANTASTSYNGKLRVKTTDYIKASVPSVTGGNTSYATSRTISVSTASSSPSGIKKYQYYKSTSSSQTGGSWTDCSTSATSQKFSSSGTFYIFFRAIDNNDVAGNISTYQTIKIDNTTPTLNMLGGGNYTLNNTSNIVSSTSYGPSGGSYSCTNTTANVGASNIASLGLGSYSVTCKITGNTGLTSSKSVTYNVTGAEFYSDRLHTTSGYKSGNSVILYSGGTQYGPYVRARSGTYWVIIYGSGFTCDSCMGNGAYQTSSNLQVTMGVRNCSTTLVHYYVTLASDAFASGIEFTTYNNCGYNMTIDKMVVTKQ